MLIQLPLTNNEIGLYCVYQNTREETTRAEKQH